MQTRTITRQWALAGAVAAMLAASTASVRAQDTTTTPSTTTTPDTTMSPSTTTTTTDMSAAPMSGSMSMGTPDYHILSNPNYDYVDLKQAQARGLSDSQIATIAKIAMKSGVAFRVVSAAVERGDTFPMLAGEYNLHLADVYQNDKEKQEIAEYISTYESIGTKSGSMMSSDMGMTKPEMEKPMTPEPAPAPEKSMASTGSETMSSSATMDIVDTAMAAKNLTTLVKALQIAGLVETLKGAGPFTVFAPDDKAFSKLPAGTLDALEADPAKLKSVLTYHVIPASVDAATAMSMTSPTSPPTVEGNTLQVKKGRHNKLMINDATVTKANIQATNGIIHIIDRVLLPPMDASGNIIPAGSSSTDTMTPATPATPATPDTTTPAAPPAAPTQ